MNRRQFLGGLGAFLSLPPLLSSLFKEKGIRGGWNEYRHIKFGVDPNPLRFKIDELGRIAQIDSDRLVGTMMEHDLRRSPWVDPIGNPNWISADPALG